MNTQYKLTAGGGKIAATLCALAAPGKPFSPLISSGFSQAAFADCLATFLHERVSAGCTPKQIAALLEATSACNASAARQALEKSSIRLDGETKDKSLSVHWGKFGSRPSAALDLALLGLEAEEEVEDEEDEGDDPSH